MGGVYIGGVCIVPYCLFVYAGGFICVVMALIYWCYCFEGWYYLFYLLWDGVWDSVLSLTLLGVYVAYTTLFWMLVYLWVCSQRLVVFM